MPRQVYNVDKELSKRLAKKAAAELKIDWENIVDDYTVKANYNDQNQVVYNVTLYKGYLGFPNCERIGEKSYVG